MQYAVLSIPRVLVTNIAVADHGIIGEMPVPALSNTAVSFDLGTLLLSNTSFKGGAKMELIA